MAQKQGNSTTDGGRLDASVGTALAAANVAIGAGWGGTATFALRAGSNDQAGVIEITASASTPAQATATVAITFADGAYAAAPRCFFVQPLTDSADVDAIPALAAADCTTTALTWTYGILPVATRVYKFAYCVIA